MPLRRRSLLRASLGAAATAVIGAPSIARAAVPWGQLPASFGAVNKYKVLEIFLPGGASQWESLWISHDGPGESQNWRGLEAHMQALDWASCAGAPNTPLETREFGIDANCTGVSWGPATKPLWRSDIFDRCRMLVTTHNEPLHSSASWYAFTGRRFGSVRAAAMGTPIQRHFKSLDAEQPIPFSYAFSPPNGGGRAYFANYTTLTGAHPGDSRPLALRIGGAMGDLLQREGVSPEADALFDMLRGQYADLLRHQHTGTKVPSAAHSAHSGAADYLTRTSALNALVGGDALAPEPGAACVSHPIGGPQGDTDNHTARSVELAARMLNNGARHVSVIDGGLGHSQLLNGGMPHDSHPNSSGVNRSLTESTSAHLFNLASVLERLISDGSTAVLLGGSAPDRINLDDTLIYIHTEFNRTPNAYTGTTDTGYEYSARNHFGSATAALLIGGPVTSRGIEGGIELNEDGDLESAVATDALTAADVHAGVLLASGVDAINPDNFTSGDHFSERINPGGNASSTALRNALRKTVLGVDNSPAQFLPGGGCAVFKSIGG